MKLVFVSSTFKDMQFERDMLHTNVIPLLDDELEAYGESIYFSDLRWGVNTSDMDAEESSKKVLKVCLDAIDDCKPYMIVLIGERYGWIPAEELLKEAATLKGIKVLDPNTSVTELEIAYGALLNPDYEGRILFYFRELDKSQMSPEERIDYEAESSIHLSKITELKNKIKALYPNYVHTYKAKWDANLKKVVELEPLMEQIKHDLYLAFKKDIDNYLALSVPTRIVNASMNLYQNNNIYYTSQKYSIDSNCDGIFNEDETDIILIKGEDGTGKSKMLANLFCTKTKDEINIPYIFGINNESLEPTNLLYVIIDEVEKALNIKHRYQENPYDFIELTEYLIQLNKKANRKKLHFNVFIDNATNDVLDYLFLLENKMNPLNELKFRLNLCFTFYIVFQENILLPPLLPFLEWSKTYSLLYIEEKKKVQYLNTMIASEHKELSKVVIDEIIKKKSSNQALYNLLMVNRLLMLDSDDFKMIRQSGDGMSAINNHMIDIVRKAPEEVALLAIDLVKAAIKHLGEEKVTRLLGCLVCYRSGISQQEISEIYKQAEWEFSNLDFLLIIKNLKSLIICTTSNYYYRIRNDEIYLALRDYLDVSQSCNAVVNYEINADVDSFAFSNLFTTTFLFLDEETTNKVLNYYFHVGDAEQNNKYLKNIIKNFIWGLKNNFDKHIKKTLFNYITTYPNEGDNKLIFRCLDLPNLNNEQYQKWLDILYELKDEIKPYLNEESNLVNNVYVKIMIIIGKHRIQNNDMPMNFIDKTFKNLSGLYNSELKYELNLLRLNIISHMNNDNAIKNTLAKYFKSPILSNFIIYDTPREKKLVISSYYNTVKRAEVLYEYSKILRELEDKSSNEMINEALAKMDEGINDDNIISLLNDDDLIYQTLIEAETIEPSGYFYTLTICKIIINYYQPSLFLKEIMQLDKYLFNKITDEDSNYHTDYHKGIDYHNYDYIRLLKKLEILMRNTNNNYYADYIFILTNKIVYELNCFVYSEEIDQDIIQLLDLIQSYFDFPDLTISFIAKITYDICLMKIELENNEYNQYDDRIITIYQQLYNNHRSHFTKCLIMYFNKDDINDIIGELELAKVDGEFNDIDYAQYENFKNLFESCREEE